MRIAIPNKGRLKEPTIQMLQAIGIKPKALDERSLIIPTNWENIEIVATRTEDIPYIVESGGAEIGITGHDYVVESDADVEELLKLDYGEGRIVLAIPRELGVKDVSQLKGREIRVATKYFNIASKYTEEKGIKAKIIRISGAAEIMPYLGAADAIIDVMSTGTTLAIHGLEPIDVVMDTYAVLIANKRWKNNNYSDLVKLITILMKGVMDAKKRKMIFMNVPDNKLEEVLKDLPAMLAPAIARLSKNNAWEVITVVDENDLPSVVSKALSKGARDIVIVGLEKVIL